MTEVGASESSWNRICITVDVEWAAPEVLADLVDLLDQRKLRATFFCTHDGVEVAGHERGLHPNFNRNGDTMREILSSGKELSDEEIYRRVLETTHAFCPEAIGVRSHCLFQHSHLWSLYRDSGLQYDSSYMLPLAAHLGPIPREYGNLELPIYYMDHQELARAAPRLRVEDLHLDRPGLKVFDFHPNPVFLNVSSMDQYERARSYYHDVDRLRKTRYEGRGVRTLFIELLDRIVSYGLPTSTMAEVNTTWRESQGA